MRTRVCLAFLFVAFTANGAERIAPAADLLALGDDQFLAAAREAASGWYGENQGPYTAGELIAVAERLLPSVKSPHERASGEGLNPFGDYFGLACLKADDRQLTALLDLYGRLHPDSFEKSTCLPQLAARFLSREVRTIRAERLRAKIDAAEPELPAELTDASNDLRRAWRLYRRAVHAYDSSFLRNGPQEPIDANANQKTFYALIEAALRGAESAGDELARYADMSAGCLGVRSIDDGKEIGALFALLRSRRLEEAIGVAVKVANSTGSISSPQLFVEPVIDLLEATGLDWEAIFVGAVVDANVGSRYGGGQVPLLNALASRGSERSALLVIELAPLVTAERREPYVKAFAQWVQPATELPSCRGREMPVIYHGPEVERKTFVTPRMHKAALHATERFATRDCAEDVAAAALNVFTRAASASSVDGIRNLAEHYAPEVAENAAYLLCALGCETPSSRAGAPVRFRVVVNGKPLAAGQKVFWMVKSPHMGRGSAAEAKEDGIVELERKNFADPRHRPTMVILAGDPQGSTDVPGFNVDMRPPADLDAVTEINIEASPVQIRLHGLEGLNGQSSDVVSIKLTPVRADSSSRHSNHNLTSFPAREAIVLPLVQHGTYGADIVVRGAERWSGQVEVGPGQPPLEIALNPGSDVSYKVSRPNRQPLPWARLMREGKDVDGAVYGESISYPSLPCGDYVLHIPSSDELNERNYTKTVRGPDELQWKARDIPITIQHGSPGVIDLGEIRVEAEN